MTEDEYMENFVFERIACRKGRPRESCPYERGTKDGNAWRKGWDSIDRMKSDTTTVREGRQS